MGVREVLNSKPWIAWTIALLAIGVAVLFYVRGGSQSAPDSMDKLSQMVTIRCTETGQEWDMNRGELMELLMYQPGMIDPTKGIPSKFAEGRPTGVIVDKGVWQETVNYVNKMKDLVKDRKHAGG
ncbi:MAG: hypothetical protein KJZ65_07195 [Phycisphaerales bacterium]|nr:hypothetical protein [Phycisphaerales bacterium]